MSAALRIDTLKFVRRLTDAGVERPWRRRSSRDSDIDSSTSRRRLTSMPSSRAQGRHRRRPIAEFKAEIFRFMLLQAVTIIGLTVTLIKLLP